MLARQYEQSQHPVQRLTPHREQQLHIRLTLDGATIRGKAEVCAILFLLVSNQDGCLQQYFMAGTSRSSVIGYAELYMHLHTLEVLQQADNAESATQNKHQADMNVLDAVPAQPRGRAQASGC